VDECERPPDPGDTSLCGNEVVPVLQQKPNLYFVLDVSGSMSLPMDGGATTRLEVAKTALKNLLLEMGHRINYGVAVFPGPGPDPSGDGSCGRGEELFETQEGDPIRCAGDRRLGPVLTSLVRVMNPIVPAGGTPLAATLNGALPRLSTLEGTSAVVLITDGAPNCGLTPCEAEECMLSVEGYSYMGARCDADLNCCDPDVIGAPLAALNCVDRSASLAAVEKLAAAGIKTYVVGIPGTEFYVDLLDQLAEAGGTAQEGSRKYFAISDSNALQDALQAIGNDVAVTCDIALQSDDFSSHLTNVYFDSSLVPFDETDGWTSTDQTIHLHGTYCDDLLAGGVVNVQVVSGCPTVVR